MNCASRPAFEQQNVVRQLLDNLNFQSETARWAAPKPCTTYSAEDQFCAGRNFSFRYCRKGQNCYVALSAVISGLTIGEEERDQLACRHEAELLAEAPSLWQQCKRSLKQKNCPNLRRVSRAMREGHFRYFFLLVDEFETTPDPWQHQDQCSGSPLNVKYTRLGLHCS